MTRYRQIGAVAITASASLALFASTASAHALTADCTAVTPNSYPDVHSRVIVDVAVNGFVEGTTAYEIDGNGQPLAVPYRADRPVYAGDLVEVSASSISDDGYEIPRTLLFSSRACGPEPPTTAVPVGTRPVAMPRIVPGLNPQKPRPRITCARLLKVGAGVRTLVKHGCRLRVLGARHWAVTGSVQSPSPGAIVADLLWRVPQLAGDAPSASSISVPAGGKSASGGVSGAERGRLVPLGIPGHPWSAKSTAPHRGVAASVTYRVGRLTVRVLYSASRGRSTTSVSAR